MSDIALGFFTAVTAGVFAAVGSILAHLLVVRRRRLQVRLNAYADLLAAIEELHESQHHVGSERHRSACQAMNLAMARVDLLAPADICAISQHSEEIAGWKRGSQDRDSWLDKLTTLMRRDIGIRKGEYRITRLEEVANRLGLPLEDHRRDKQDSSIKGPWDP